MKEYMISSSPSTLVPDLLDEAEDILHVPLRNPQVESPLDMRPQLVCHLEAGEGRDRDELGSSIREESVIREDPSVGPCSQCDYECSPSSTPTCQVIYYSSP
jgi:hypothetical protein